jgi:hypothetical protein
VRRVLSTFVAVALTAGAGMTSGASANNASLRGSPAAMLEQNRVAKDHGLPFYRTAEDIAAGVRRGDLVPLAGDANYEVADFVRYSYAHPAARLFVERLSAQYRESCGQKLVVTSAVRPSTGQPSNAHALSVHPAGMAIDLRVSDSASCRAWLEDALLNLEERGVLNGIREFRPPHYHVAIFPVPYMAYAEERMAAELAQAEAALAEARVAEARAESAPTRRAEAGVVLVAADAAPISRTGVTFAAALALLLAVPLGTHALRRRRRTD